MIYKDNNPDNIYIILWEMLKMKVKELKKRFRMW